MTVVDQKFGWKPKISSKEGMTRVYNEATRHLAHVHALPSPGGQHVTTKRVGDTLTIEHLPNKRGLRIVDQQTGEVVSVPLSLVRALSSALLDAAADVAGEVVGDIDTALESGNAQR